LKASEDMSFNDFGFKTGCFERSGVGLFSSCGS
jgi:hypothetical protein